MIGYDIDKLPQDLESWIGQRFLPPVLSLEGGWEYWIQIDFPAWLDVAYREQFAFRREVPITSGEVRLDWLINDPAPHGIEPLTAVEIKAQSHKYDTAAFVAGVDRDLEKLRRLNRDLVRLCLAVTCDVDAYRELRAQQFLELFRFPDDSAACLLKRVES